MKAAVLLGLSLWMAACGGKSQGTPGSGGVAGAAGVGGSGAGAGNDGGTTDECITDTTPKPDHVFVCSELKWNVSVPDPCATTECGLIFDVHGFSMSGAMEERNTNLAELGQLDGYIVVQPNADPPPPDSVWAAAEDDPKVFDFMLRMMKAFHVDRKRIHFTGFSQGGDMTWRFICDHSDIIASAAPASFGHSVNENCFSKGNRPPREMPILYVHGTQDNVIPFSNAITARDEVVSVLDMTESGVVSSDGSHIWTRYKDAKATVFEFIQHDYTGDPFLGGHCFPGSSDPGGEPGQFFSFRCAQSAAFIWGDEVMKFFQAHPMPP